MATVISPPLTLEELGLGNRQNEKVNRYSGGMAQRLMIARALS